MYESVSKFDKIREESRSSNSNSLKIGDSIFLSVSEKMIAEPDTARSPLLERMISIDMPKEFFLSCSNTKGVNMDLCTEDYLNTYSYLGIFEVLPKISDFQSETQKFTKDQLELFYGYEIKYGDRIVLRHLYSGGYLSPNLKNQTKMKGSWKLELKDSESVSTEFLPSGLSKSLGEPVLINDLVSVAFTLKNKKLFLNADRYIRKQFVPAAHLVSSDWKISLFQRGEIDFSKVCYGSPIQIKGHTLNLKLSKHNERSKNKSKNAVYLKGKESCYNIWVLERFRDHKPYSMLGGYVELNDRLFIRNLATKEYITKDLRLVKIPEFDDFFELCNESLDTANKIIFGNNVMIRNYNLEILCIDEESFVQSSLAKVMYPIKKFRDSTQKSAPISLYHSTKNISNLFEIVKPSTSTAKIIRKINPVSLEFNEYSKFIDGYLVTEHSLHILKHVMVQPRHELNIDDMIEELKTITQMLVSMIEKQKNLAKLKKIQRFMEKLNIHNAVLRLLDSITKKIYPEDQRRYLLNDENKRKLQESCEILWNFLKKGTLNNKEVCFKMLNHLRLLAKFLMVYPEHVSNYIGVILEGSFPDIQTLEDFTNVLFYQLGPISKETLMIDTNCFNSAAHSFIYKGEILRAHQKVARKIIIENYNFFPISLIEDNSVLYVAFELFKGISASEIVENNLDFQSVFLQKDDKGLVVPLQEFVNHLDYTEYLIKFLKLYRLLYDRTSIEILDKAYSRIGLTHTSINQAIESSNTPLSIKKELIFFAVSYILSNSNYVTFNKFCIMVNEDFLKFNTNKEKVIKDLLAREKSLKSLRKQWKSHIIIYIEENSLEEERFILSLLENSVSLAKKNILPLKDLESISKDACKFVKFHLRSNSKRFLQHKISYLKRILTNFIQLTDIYIEQKLVDSGKLIVNSLLQTNKDSKLSRTVSEDIDFIGQHLLQNIKGITEANIPEISISFSELMSEALANIILFSNQFDPKINLRVLKILKKYYSPSNYFLRSFRKIELYISSSTANHIQRIVDLKLKISDPNLINTINFGTDEEKMLNMKLLRNTIGEIVALIDPRNPDAYQTYHLQNIMRNYELFEKTSRLWKIIQHDVDDPILEKERLKTITAIIVFTYAFIRNNPVNQQIIEKRLNWKLFEQVGLLAAVVQQSTQFAHLNSQKIRSYIENLLKSFLFTIDRPTPSMLKWIISLMFKDKKKVSHETQVFVADKILYLLSHQGAGWDKLEDRESVGESIYILSFCCIDNGNVRKKCLYFFKYHALVRIIKQDYPFCMKRGVINLLYRLYFETGSFDQNHADLEEGISTILDFFEGKLTSIQMLAEKGAYEMIPPKEKSYKVEIKHCKDFHDDNLYLAWTFACYEYTFEKTGLIYFFPSILKDNRNLSFTALEKLKSIQDQMRSIFEEDFYFEDLYNDITTCIGKLEGQFILKPKEDLFAIPTDINEEQQVNHLLSSLYEDLEKKYYETKTNFNESFTELIIKESPFFTNLVSNKLGDEDKKQIKNFIRLFLIKSTSLEQIRVFYGFLNCLFKKCRKKRKISQLFIQSNIISESLQYLQNTIRPKLQLIVLEFFTTTCRQKTTIIQELVLKRLCSLNLTFFLFNDISETLKSTVMSCLDYKEISRSSFKFQLANHYLQFLASLCDNCNLKLQQFMESQVSQNNSKNINLLRVVFELVTDLTENNHHLSSRDTIKILVRNALETLIEFTTGPCKKNQMFLIKNIQTYLIINSLFAIEYDFEDDLELELYSNAVNFLCLLTEEDPEILKKLPKYLDISLILQQINYLYCEISFQSRHSKYKLTYGTLLENGVNLVIFIIKYQIAFPYDNAIQGLKQDNFETSNLGMMSAASMARDSSEVPANIDERPEIKYFKYYVGCVEIERDGEILKHYFQIPFLWKNLTMYTTQKFIESVDHTSRANKLENLLQEVLYIQKEMNHQEKIKQKKCLKFLSNNWKLFGRINYLVLVIINLLLLVYSVSSTDNETEFNFESVSIEAVIDLGSFILMLLSLLSILGYVYEYYPTIILRSHRSENRKFRVSSLLGNSSTVSKSRNIPNDDAELIHESSHVGYISKRKRIFYLLKDNHILYEIFYLAIAYISISQPICYSILLLDVMRISNTLRDVFRSLTKNFKQLVLTFFLGCICMFIYSNIGFLYLSDNFDRYGTRTASALTYCDTLWECFVSTFYNGPRLSGGIGDGLIKADLDKDESNYYNRLIFDVTFFIVINVILMNVIFGIIIDTFAQLRDIRNEQAYHKENICFICHQKRSFFELQNQSFLSHAMEIHNIWAYLFFLCYIRDKKEKDCTGLEKYVKRCMKREDISFFPTNTKSLRDKNINPD